MSYGMDELPYDILEALKCRLTELQAEGALPVVTEEVERWIAYVQSSIDAFDEDGNYVGEQEEDEDEESEMVPASAWSPMLDDDYEPGDMPDALIGGDDGFAGFAPPEGK